jgi:hypothetical protein
MKRKNKGKISLRFASNFFLFRFVSLPVFLFLFRLQYPVQFKGTVARDFLPLFYFHKTT